MSIEESNWSNAISRKCEMLTGDNAPYVRACGERKKNGIADARERQDPDKFR